MQACMHVIQFIIYPSIKAEAYIKLFLPLDGGRTLPRSKYELISVLAHSSTNQLINSPPN